LGIIVYDRALKLMTASLRPRTLIAELTYQCALRCGYCWNPLDLSQNEPELDTSGWLSTLEQAAALGVSDVRFSGGEPLLRDDLERLVRKARELDLRSTLITSGVPLGRERLVRLARAGLDSVQLSVQDTTEWGSRWIAGQVALGQKLLVATWVKALGLPLTLSAVLQRTNIGRTAELIALAERIGAERVELVNTRYLSWALHNRAALLPTRAELVRARGVARREKRRLRGKVEVSFDVPDYYSDTPKACMDGWGRRYRSSIPRARCFLVNRPTRCQIWSPRA
jgi:pyrroloquinoline quinone biosynthesis protein E